MTIYYKATDKNMQCRGYQFVLGEWSTPVDGEVELCKNGYHFCVSPSGVWAYYFEEGTRVFECEVQDAQISKDAGADAKSVCRSLRLVREVVIGGDQNTGDQNTGNWNACNNSSGAFCSVDPVYSFDRPVKGMTRDEFYEISAVQQLGSLLMEDKPFDYSAFSSVPNATPKKVKALHQKFIALRAKAANQ